MDARNPAYKLFLRDIEGAAPALGLQVQALELRRLDDVENSFQAALDGRAEAVIATASGIFITNQDRERLARLAIETRLPMLHSESAFVLAGGLMLGYHRIRIFRSNSAGQPRTWTKFLKAQNPLTFQLSSRQIRVGDQPEDCTADGAGDSA